MFGKSRGLLDLRSEEEKQRALQHLIGASGVQPAGIRGMFGRGPMGDTFAGTSLAPETPLDVPAGVGANKVKPIRNPTLDDAPRLPVTPDNGSGYDHERKGVFKLVGDAPDQQGPSPWITALGMLGAGLRDAQASIDGRQGGAMDSFSQAMNARRSAQQAALADYRQRQQVANLPGMSQREFLAYRADPKAWGSNMSKAATSRYDAATLNPGDQRFLGEGGGVYQAPTRGEQYAQSLELTPGTEAYNNAIRDQELGANGPTGFSNSQTLQNDRNAQAAALERLRQQGRVAIEGTRQDNRITTRSAPTYRDLNQPPPRAGGASRIPAAAPKVRTATGENGQKIYLRNGQWVDEQGRPVQ